MSTAKKTLYAAIGAGGLALEKARELPQRAVSIPSTLSTRRGALRELPKTLQQFRASLPDTATRLFEQSRELPTRARKQTETVLVELSTRGERLVKKVSKSAPTKRAVARTKTAKSQVKAAATSTKKAVTAEVEAVQAALDTASEAV